MSDPAVLALPDGRHLAWREWGDPAGPLVLLAHGTPGSRHQLTDLPREPGAPPARFVSLDRPGYGASTFHRAATVVSAADDVARLADHLGVTAFYVLGYSGGTPLALAAAATLADRVRGAAVVSAAVPPAPTDDEAEIDGAESGADQPSDGEPEGADTDPEEPEGDEPIEFLAVPEPTLAQRGRARAQVVVAHRSPRLLRRTLRRQMGPADAAALDRPDVFSRLVADTAHPSRTTARAVLQDVGLCGDVWQLPLEEITAPVQIFHGTADQTVPVARSRELAAATPTATLHEVADAGHFLVFDHFGTIIDALLLP